MSFIRLLEFSFIFWTKTVCLVVINKLRAILNSIMLAIIMMSTQSCTFVGFALGYTMDSRKSGEHIEYINKFNTPARIKKEFPLILHNYWVKTEDGKDVHIIVSSMRKNVPTSFQCFYGKQLVNHDDSDSQAFIEFQLIDEKVVYWESVGVYINRKANENTGIWTVFGHMIDLAIVFLYVNDY